MKYTVWLLLVGLVVLHQDFWQQKDSTLMFGFLPYSLFYHGLLSIGAAVVWWMAVRFCWPERVKAVDLEAAAAKGGER